MMVNWRGRLLLEICVIFQLQLFVTNALREMLMRAPTAVLAGGSMRLQCDYDLESAALYSIKWYRDDQEFYRYVPKEDPPRRTFHVDPPLDVDLSASGPHEVKLLRTMRAQSGVYKCEVTADAPLFHTDIRSAHVTVAQIGSGGVILRPADTLSAHYDPRYPAAVCTAPPAYPAVNFTWYVNGKKILPKYGFVKTVIDEDTASKLSETRSKILMGALEDSGLDTVRVRCEVTILDAYREIAELNIEPPVQPVVPPVGPITGPTAPLGLSDNAQYSTAGMTIVNVKIIVSNIVLILMKYIKFR